MARELLLPTVAILVLCALYLFEAARVFRTKETTFASVKSPFYSEEMPIRGRAALVYAKGSVLMGAILIIMWACNLVLIYIYPQAIAYICGMSLFTWMLIMHLTFARAIHFQAQANRQQRIEDD